MKTSNLDRLALETLQRLAARNAYGDVRYAVLTKLAQKWGAL